MSETEKAEHRGGILKVLPFFRNINEEQVTVRGLSDKERQKQTETERWMWVRDDRRIEKNSEQGKKKALLYKTES